MEPVEFTFHVDGNRLIIVPAEIKDSSQYIISIDKLVSKKDPNKTAEHLRYTVTTAVSPMYCTVADLKYLIDIFDIPTATVLYYIREASRYADYMRSAEGSSLSKAEITFAVRQFVRVKTTYDCLIRAYVRKATGIGQSGKLGVIEFKEEEKYSDAFADLLDELKKAIKSWGDALRGFEREGRVKPRSVKRHYKETEQTKFSDIVDDLTRDLPGTV